MSQYPNIFWAQRKDRIFVTIDVKDIKDEQIELKEDSFSFKGSNKEKKYEVNVELFKKVNTNESKYNVLGSMVQIILIKQDKEEGFWKRLTQDDKKNNFIKVDWNKYVDEDEEEEEGNKGLGQDWDPSMMQNFGGMGGMGGNPGMGGMGGMGEGDDSDDEEQGIDDLDAEQDKEENKKEDEQIKQ